MAGLRGVFCIAMDAHTSLHVGGLPGILKVYSTGATQVFSPMSVQSISCSQKWLYYADHANGIIGRLHLNVAGHGVLLTNRRAPIAVRWDPSRARIYFLEAGTDANEYKDGRLFAYSPPDPD